MHWTERLREIRQGFESSFWVANVTELFERLAFYGQMAVLAIFLHESLGLSAQLTATLIGYFGFVVWLLPVFGGSLADRFGFRRSLACAYLILAVGYFLMGSLDAPWMAPLRKSLPPFWLVLLVLMVPALGPSVVKPVVAGTTGRASRESVRSIGYSIYYTLVNVGGTLGPIVAYRVRQTLGIENVFRVSALFVLLMFFATLLFYREPSHAAGKLQPGVSAFRNMLSVLHNVRFLIFLLIFSGFWIVFWQQFVALPLYLRGYVDPQAKVDLLLSVDPATVIAFQVLVSFLTRKVPAFAAMTIGVAIASLSWLIVAWRGSTPAVAAALFVLAIGEITQSPRYYEYVSRLAPEGQQGTYMGYAFLPVAIGSLVGGEMGGFLLHYFGEVLRRPREIWFVFSAVGLATAGAMWLYGVLWSPKLSPTAQNNE